MQPNTVEILLSINASVKDIAKSMSPQNGDDARTTAKLSRGDIANKSDIEPAKDKGLKTDLSVESLGDVVRFLNSLSPGILAIAKLSGRQIRRFTDVIEKVLSSIQRINDYTKDNGDSIKNAETLFGSMNTLADSIKKSSSLPVYAPLSLLGYTIARKAIEAYIKLIDKVGEIGDVAKKVKKLNQITRSIDSIIKVVMKGALLLGVCMGLGLLVAIGPTRQLILAGLIVLGATLVVTMAIIGLVGLTARFIKETKAFKGIREIIFLTLAAMGIVILSVALGVAINALGGIKSILYGLGIIFGTVVALALLFGFIGLVAKEVLNKDTFFGIAGLILLTFGAMGIILAAEWLGKHVQGKHDAIMSGIEATGTIMVALVGIGFLAGKLLNNAKKGIAALAVMEILALGAMGLVYVVLKLENLRKENDIKWGDFYLNLAAVSSIVAAFGVLAVAAGALIQFIAPGILALAGIELIALGAIGISVLLIRLHNTAKDANVEFLQLEKDVLWMSAIIGTFGLLAGAFGLIFPAVIAGAVALSVVEVMSLGTIGITSLLIKLHNKAKDAGVSFKQLEKDVLWMSSVIGSFGVLAGAMSLLVVPITLGLPAMALTTTFALAIIHVISQLVDVAKAIKDAGGAEFLKKTVANDIPMILSNINAKNFDISGGILKMGYIAAKYSMMGELISGVMTVVDAISKISQASGVIDSDGNISPVLRVDPVTGEVEYGKPVDIKNIATVISETVQVFVENIKFGMDHVSSMYNAKDIFKVLATLIDPISKFVEMLVKYDSNGTKLCTVTVDEKGVVKKGAEVDVAKVATTISSAISEFVTALYAKENTEKWSELIYGDRTFFQRFLGKTNDKAKSVSEVAGILGIIIDPVCSFVDMLVGLNPTENGNLSRLVYDNNGNPKEGKPVNVARSAQIISRMISAFVKSIYGPEGLAKYGEYDVDAVEKILNPVNNIIKIAEQLSQDKISPDKVIKNSSSISTAMTSLSIATMSMDVDMMTSVLNPLKEFVSIGQALGLSIDGNKIITNSKSIATFMTDVVDKRLPSGSDKIDKFASSVKNLKTAFADLDDVLVKEEDKRKKALEEFTDTIKTLMEVFDEAKPSIDSFKDVIDAVQNFDSIKLESLQQTKQYTQPAYTVYNQPSVDSYGNTNTGTVQTKQEPSITSADIETAIENVFTRLHIIANPNTIGSDDINEILKNMAYDFAI